ncbi:hypothetical protein IKS86_03925 [bacterium]|nr:hypothetical protein [bacterium]
MKNLIAKINKIPLWVAFLIYEVLILVRIAVEMQEAMIWIFIMQLFWFNCVLMFFVIGFKYILKLKNSDLPVLFLGGFLTYIPMLYSLLMDHKWHLNFINPVSVKQVAFDMITLLAVHEYDWPMFPELVLLLSGSFALGFLLSGKVLRSACAAVFSTYTSFFCLGFSWFAVNPNHPSFSHFTLPLPDHVAYSLFYILFFLVLALIAFFREIRALIKNIFA